MSKLYKNNTLNYKKNRIILKNVHKRLILIILFLFLTSLYLLYKANNIFTETKTNFINEILITNGFIIKNIEILGINHLDKNDITKIISSYNNINIFDVNFKKIYEEITNNTWVKEATIEVIYPDTIKILLTEKEPIAIWQNRYGNNLVTKTGDLIFEKRLENFKNYLPIIIGHNANKNIYSILNILGSDKNFVKNIWSLTFVNERRWNLHFNQGLTIKLPSKNLKNTWEKVVYLNQNYNILNLGLTEIDLRNPYQILGKINIDKELIFNKKNL